MGEHLQKKKFSCNFNLELGRVENIVEKEEISPFPTMFSILTLNC